MAPSPSSRGGAAKPRTPPAFARDLELERAAAGCSRHLTGDGPRRAEALLATIPVDSAVDYYGIGGVVAELEGEVAGLLGKEAALFLPTGTMAQQATLRVHADRRTSRSVAFHPSCHLETNEERGYERLHGLYGIPVGPLLEPLTAASLQRVHEPVAALLIELPQRSLGGTLPTFGELTAQVAWARERSAAVHLDGARLWESGPYYASSARKSLADVAGLFDTVYVSFYKGLGAIAGCCVAGDGDVIEELSVWRTRHGGRSFGLWPYAASALTRLRERLPRMAAYQRHARAIARAVADVPGVEVLPEQVRSTMLHLRIGAPLGELRARALAIAASDDVWTFARPFVSEGPRLQRYELSVGEATLELSPAEVRGLVERLVGAAPLPARPRRRASTTGPGRARRA